MERKSYHKPVFRTYGNITVLTQTVNGTGRNDGGGAQAGNRNRTS